VSFLFLSRFVASCNNLRFSYSAESVKKELTPDKVHLIPADLADPDSIKKVLNSHLERWDGKLDILVNNASKQIMCTKIEELDVSFFYLSQL
jgi:NADP-dependent 3-hydroxy acid dehydrogenase YdfG